MWSPRLLFLFLLIFPLNGISVGDFNVPSLSLKQEWIQPNNKTNTEKKRSNYKAHRFNLDFNLDKILIIFSDTGLHDPQSEAKCMNNYRRSKQTNSTDFQRGLTKLLGVVILSFMAMLLKTILLTRKCAMNEQKDLCFVKHNRCPPGSPYYRGNLTVSQ